MKKDAKKKDQIEVVTDDFLKVLKETGKQKIKSLTELKENNLYIIEDDEPVVEISLSQALKEKGLLISDLAKLTGISRQNINAVIRNKLKPGVDFVLKVSFVLGEPIENLFQLTDNAWVKPIKIGRDTSVFVDVLHLRLVDNREKRNLMETSKDEYFNKKTKETYTKITYEQMIKEYVDSKMAEKEEKLFAENPEMSRNAINSIVIEELKAEFGSRYSKIYKKLGQKFVPYTLDQSKRK